MVKWTRLLTVALCCEVKSKIKSISNKITKLNVKQKTKRQVRQGYIYSVYSLLLMYRTNKSICTLRP